MLMKGTIPCKGNKLTTLSPHMRDQKVMRVGKSWGTLKEEVNKSVYCYGISRYEQVPEWYVQVGAKANEIAQEATLQGRTGEVKETSTHNDLININIICISSYYYNHLCIVLESMEIEVRYELLAYEGGFIYCRSLHLHEHAK
jgi:hypothetical protein